MRSSPARRARCDVVIVDTAGRLATQAHLMEELKKIKRVIGKAEAGAPHEVLLVIDGNTGQNALAQVQAFDDGAAAHGAGHHQARRHGQGRRAGGDRALVARAQRAAAGLLRGRRREARRPADLRAREFAAALVD